MAKGLGTLTVWLTADTKKFESGLASAKRTLLSWKNLSIAGVASAGAGLAAFGVKSVKAYMESEKASAGLAAALKDAAGVTGSTLPLLQKHAAMIQKKTKFEDDSIISAMALGRNLGIEASKLDEAATAAVGFASTLGMDVNSAMTLIGKASQGNTTALGRYGIKIDDTKSAQEKFNEVLKMGTERFAQAEAQTGTMEGRLAQMDNAWGDIKESIGEVIATVLDLGNNLDGGTGKLQEFAAMFQRNIPAMANFVQELFTTVSATFQKFWALLSTSFENLSSIFSWFGENWNKLWTDAPLIVFSVIGDILLAFRNLGESIFKIADATWEAIKEILKGGDIGDALSQVLEVAVDSMAKTISDIGRETEKQLNKSGVTELKLKGLDDVSKQFAAIDEEAAKRREKIFDESMAKLNAPAMDVGKPGAAGAVAKQAAVKQESSIVSAVMKGSVEALRIENSRTTKDDKIADNTKRTATATEKMLVGINKIANGMGGMAFADVPEDVF